MFRKRILLLMALLVASLTLGLAVTAAQDAPPDGFDPGVAPSGFDTNQQTTTIVTAQTATTSISALGSIEANMTVSPTFVMGGTISEILVQAGQTVQVGQILARLDTTNAQIAYDQARLNLENARINYDTLLEPASEDDLRIARANLASAQAAYSSSTVSEEEIAAAELRYKQAQDTYNAQVTSRYQMNGTDEQIALKEAQIGAASFNMEIARLQLESVQQPDNGSLWSASLRITQAQLQLKQLEEGPSQSQLDSAIISLTQAQARLQDAQTTLDRMQLVAPVSGVITSVPVKVGDTVTAATTILEIADISQLWITTPINELDVDLVSIGIPATIQLDALPGVDIPGVVEAISWLSATSSDGIVTYDARISLTTQDERVRIGMTGEAVINLEGSTN